ncbi:unnamed protein product [Rangifer tarandus platyrhynchus]|uniref:Uncharacterized protein n=2 Tax=Rangifer tarandus platyrhynchus TaxID=3082113 RepID=A0ABN8YTH6_RANTA|nr:unnamed protein product [Rangifer tarandus platyrhynchus]
MAASPGCLPGASHGQRSHSVHRVVTSQIQLSSMQAVANLVRKGKKKKAKPSFFKLSIPCPGELILQNPGGRGETPERWRTCFMAEMQPEVGLEQPAKDRVPSRILSGVSAFNSQFNLKMRISSH